MSLMQYVKGPNFSGRTTFLRTLVQRCFQQNEQPVAYIGPEIFTSFSGLTNTVAAELELAGEGNIEAISTSLGITHLIHRNLSTLSGGEEALCSIAAGLALLPRMFALDCVMEQLDSIRRQSILRVLERSPVKKIVIADNRFGEWHNDPIKMDYIHMSRYIPCQYKSINGEASLPICPDEVDDITISNLNFKYPKCTTSVLENINLRLPAGKIIHIDGPNAAGKSTLSKILVGILVPSSGKVSHNGDTTFWKKPGRVAAYHFQNPDMQLFRSTVLSELTAGAKINNRGKRTISELVDSAISAFGLSNILKMHPQELPYSMRKRVAMAATVACGTPWIILDEPTLGQDIDSTYQITKFIKRLAKSGKGIIIISHSRSFIDSFSTKRVILHEGKIFEGFDNGGKH